MLVIASVISLSAAARQHSEANIEVRYNYEYARPTVDSIKYDSDEMLLQLAPDESRFFSVKTEFYDSLVASPGGSELVGNMMMDALNKTGSIKKDADGKITSITINKDDLKDVPQRGVRVNVYKYPEQNSMTVYDATGGQDKVVYTWDLPLDEIAWEPGDSVANILGYECQNATADYHGRHWTVWYAPDIPVADGPWQPCGLPGLVLKAESDGAEYRFTATAVNGCKTIIKDMPGDPDIEKSTRKDFRKTEADMIANPGKNYGFGNKFSTTVYHDLIETDYKD